MINNSCPAIYATAQQLDHPQLNLRGAYDRNPKEFFFIINDSPYGSERAYNALRHAMTLSKREETKLRVFLIGDGVNCAIANQKTPDGYYNIERMLGSLFRRAEAAT